MKRLMAGCASVVALMGGSLSAAPLNLGGYADESGAISVQYEGATLDPYFALQALLLAHENGLETARIAEKWAEWLLPRQKPDGTFDRFCRRANVWAPCKTADADDSLMAMWLRFLETMPNQLAQREAWQKSHAAARLALAKLVDPRSRIFFVSPVYQHGLFMDNLEVWTYKPAHAMAVGAGSRPQGRPGRAELAEPDGFARAIHDVFWDSEHDRFLVSTQPEQRHEKRAFYPDAVAQIFPLTVGFPLREAGSQDWYRRWMKEHRAEWLRQVETDFAWGLVAIVAWKQGDTDAAGCWLRRTQRFRHSVHWTVTDEVVAQVLAARGVDAVAEDRTC